MAARGEKAYLKLREAIISGELKPRERLIETELGQYLGVSRPTVRAALIRLENEGMVVTEPHRGSTVRAFTLEEALDTLRIREVLEGLVARIAAEKATEEDVGRLHGIVGQMEEVVKTNDLPKYPPLNAAFHKTLLEIADNEQVERILSSLNHSLIRFQFRTVFVPGRTALSWREHQEILNKIAVKDGDGAEAAARFHVSQVRSNLALTIDLPVY